MAALALALLLFAFTGSTSANWCVCKDGSDQILQKTLDYACGAGADCNPIHQNGPCFQPNTVRAHCSYAVNSFFQKKGQGPGTCDFAGTATVVTSDPSVSGCSYPSSASTAGTTTTPTTGTTTPTSGTTTPTSGTTSPYTGTGIPSTTTGSGSTSTATPYGTTPGVLGGIGNGMGPTGAGMTTDDTSDGGLRLVDHISVLFLGFMMMRLQWGF
ncbi:hypothetical protein QN277_006859 [Acacia crassicarpa]|uniref:X8 domain-containing protein n=1 Tax=Acacia crassicarpa TaxID=499986 RepID=A0AAE1MEQ5_9FABA|nr:hypothetical protein QN277_006859 [Acacia crassicarpa]